MTLDLRQFNRNIVLENDVIFGSVNANRAHYEQRADALRQAGRSWLERFITRRVPTIRWQEALVRRPGDVKTVLELSE